MRTSLNALRCVSPHRLPHWLVLIACMALRCTRADEIGVIDEEQAKADRAVLMDERKYFVSKNNELLFERSITGAQDKKGIHSDPSTHASFLSLLLCLQRVLPVRALNIPFLQISALHWHCCDFLRVISPLTLPHRVKPCMNQHQNPFVFASTLYPFAASILQT